MFFYSNAPLTMNDGSSIHDNRAREAGGGVWIGTQEPPVLTGVTCGPGGNVYGNTPDDCYIEP
jgi:hypothetical protein